MRKLVRNYLKLVNEIININSVYKIEIIGFVEYFDIIYPMLALKYISKMNNKTIIIEGCHHGEEYFTVNILLKWIKEPMKFPEFNYYIYPCINMFGYAYNCRNNGNNQETNNAIHFHKDSEVPELKILFEEFPRTADLLLDIHADAGRHGKKEVYCYEHKAENLPSIAEKTLIENDAIIPYLKQKTIYKTSLKNGVIIPPAYDVELEAFLEKAGIQYSLALELPGKMEGQKRAEGGIAIINSILKNFREVK